MANNFTKRLLSEEAKLPVMRELKTSLNDIIDHVDAIDKILEHVDLYLSLDSVDQDMRDDFMDEISDICGRVTLDVIR